MYYGTGFTHSDVYRMPTYLRRFYMDILVKTKEQESKEQEKRNKRSR